MDNVGNEKSVGFLSLIRVLFFICIQRHTHAQVKKNITTQVFKNEEESRERKNEEEEEEKNENEKPFLHTVKQPLRLGDISFA